MSQFFVPLAASFPQTGENRPVADILDDLADYVGGGDRPAAQARARRALLAAVRTFNTVAWRFNRQRQTITFVNDKTDYDLNSDFRSPRAAHLLNADSEAIDILRWIAYEDWARYEIFEDSTTSFPDSYTARNAFRTGKVTFIPPLGTISASFPAARLDYHSRILVPTSDGAVLSVPSEVEEAIVQEAVAIIVAKSRSFIESRDARAVARALRADIEREWRDWPDSSSRNEA